MYEYESLRPTLLTDEGQRMFLKIRDHTQNILKIAGCIRMDIAMQGSGGGDTWLMIACVDRMVELNEIVEIEQKSVACQHRIFVKEN